MTRHLLVNTGGGDAPGLNAAIRAVTLSAVRRGFRVTGIRRGYSGLLEEDGRGLIPLGRDEVRGITDLGGTEVTFGFDSAMSFAADAITRLHSTAEAHGRVMVVELMGRDAGWLALHAGLAGSAHVILLPEIDFDPDVVARSIQHRWATGRPFAVVVVAEGAKQRGAGRVMKVNGRAEPTLGGVGALVEAQIAERTGLETRSLVLGHLQRGGAPTPADRLLALRYGAEAARLAADGKWGRMVSWQPPNMASVTLAEALAQPHVVPLTNDAILAARDFGVCLGDG
jgi:6-phosphofructokinase